MFYTQTMSAKKWIHFHFFLKDLTFIPTFTMMCQFFKRHSLAYCSLFENVMCSEGIRWEEGPSNGPQTHCHTHRDVSMCPCVHVSLIYNKMDDISFSWTKSRLNIHDKSAAVLRWWHNLTPEWAQYWPAVEPGHWIISQYTCPSTLKQISTAADDTDN